MGKKFLAVCSLMLIFVLAACAAQPTLVILPPVNSAPSADSTQPAAANAGTGSGSNPNTLDNRLAYGILKLEGTGNAVTAAQAKQMLPYWKQLQTIMSTAAANSAGGSNSTTAGDMQTVYQQIQQVLTPDQVTAIEQDSMTQADIQTLMQRYNIQVTPGAGFNGGNFPTLSPEERATRAAQFQQTPGAGGGRGFGGSGTPRANGTPGANGNRGFRGGMNFIFLDTVINLLQQRSGS